MKKIQGGTIEEEVQVFKNKRSPKNNGKNPIQYIVNIIDELVKENCELRKRLEQLEKQTQNFEANIEMLMKELIRTGCVKIGDKREPMKRMAFTQEVLINVLKKRGYITNKHLQGEFKKIRKARSER